MSFAEDYVDVATRIRLFRQKYPEGSLQPFDPSEPLKVVTIGDRTHLQYVACAYRTPDDQRPGIGVAWETFPGRTPYTRESEAMVAETSAWGRAIVATLAADTKKGIASAEEVRGSKERQNAVPPADALRDALRAYCQEAGLDLAQVAQDYADGHDGNPLKDAAEKDVRRFLNLVKTGDPDGGRMSRAQKVEHNALVKDTLELDRPAERLQGPDPLDPWVADGLPKAGAE